MVTLLHIWVARCTARKPVEGFMALWPPARVSRPTWNAFLNETSVSAHLLNARCPPDRVRLIKRREGTGSQAPESR